MSSEANTKAEFEAFMRRIGIEGPPKTGDRLFKPEYEAIEERHPGWTGWSLYAKAYWNALEVLEKTITQSGGTGNMLKYALLFLFRHFVELSLKSILVADSHQAPPTHDLKELWGDTRVVLLRVWPDINKEWVKTFESCVHELAKIDLQSVEFRYPVGKHGTPTLRGFDVGAFDFNNCSVVMKRMEFFLGTALEAVLEYNSEP